MNLKNLLTIFRRETAAYFNAAIAYIFIIVFVLLTGSLFMTQFFVIGRADMRSFFGVLPYIVCVFLPAVTMRLWAEDRRGNTLELLLTFPMRPQELVLGKFFASLLFYGTALAGTATIPVMLKFLGNPDMGSLLSAYLGALLLGAFYMAIGIFISGLSRDQIVAFILTMVICFGLYLAGTEFVASSIDGWIPGVGTLLRNFLGSARHYDSFQKGVIDNRDVIYFLIGTVIFLTLNGFSLEGRSRPKAKAVFTTATLICAGIFFTSNWALEGVQLGRFDLSEGKIYTVSPATKKILKELKAPVTAKLYISPMDQMPTGLKTLEQDVRDKFDELRVASNGKFQYKIFHMEAANITEGSQTEGKEESLEQQLSAKGIQPFQVRSIQSDEVGVRLVYGAIGLAYKEKPDEIIPRVMPDNVDELEYLLMSKVYKMTLSSVPKIALVAPYQEKQVEPEMRALLAQLGGQIPEGYREDDYEVLPKALDYAGYQSQRIKFTEKEPIPEDVNCLILMEPENLNDRQRYEIGRFLRKGGSVLLAVQNYQYGYSLSGRDLIIQSEDKKPNINSLLYAWGLEVDEQILVDEQHDVINIGGGASMGPFEMSVPVKVPIQVLIPRSGMNEGLSITSRLNTLFYLWGTALKINDQKVQEQGLKVDTLFSSSERSWTVPFKEGSLKPENLWPVPEGRKGPFPLAIMVQGQFPDPSQGGEAPPWPSDKPVEPPKEGEEKKEEPKPAPLPAVTPAPGKLILVGDVMMFRKYLVRSGGHLNLFLNAVDALTLGEDLITIRSKQPIDRSIGRVSSGVKVGWRLFTTLAVPVFIAIVGTLRVFLRRRSKQNYLKLLSSVSHS